MDGHDGKELAERPVIKQRLENREVTDVLVAERSFELLYFLGHKAQVAMHIDDLLRELPANGFDLRFGFEIEQPEIEHLLRFFLDVLAVMQALDAIATLKPLFHLETIMHQPVVFLGGLDFELGRSPFDGAECFHDKHGMVRDNGASALANNGGMRNAFRIAYVHNVPNDVIGIFLKRIISRAVEVAARPVVINPETAPHVEIAELVPKLA